MPTDYAVDPLYGTFSKIRTARQDHNCNYPGCVIHKGERYLDEVVPPWTLIADDVDDDGRPVGGPAGEWMRTRQHLVGQHNQDGFVDLYHRTTPEAKAEILRTRRYFSKENRGHIYMSNRPDPQSQAAGYGDAIIHIRIPEVWVELDDEFPDGERHYRIQAVRAMRYIVEDEANA